MTLADAVTAVGVFLGAMVGSVLGRLIGQRISRRWELADRREHEAFMRELDSRRVSAERLWARQVGLGEVPDPPAVTPNRAGQEPGGRGL